MQNHKYKYKIRNKNTKSDIQIQNQKHKYKKISSKLDLQNTHTPKLPCNIAQIQPIFLEIKT